MQTATATATERITREIDPVETLKNNLVIITGVSNGREWKRAAFRGDSKKSKSRNRAFDYDLIAMLEAFGVQEFALGSRTKDAAPSAAA